jgi:hypothetical protein
MRQMCNTNMEIKQQFVRMDEQSVVVKIKGNTGDGLPQV